MEVRLLGPMEAADDNGDPLPIQGSKLRALLAILALECGRVVTTDRLIDELWHDDPPAGVANALQSLVSKLRKAVGSTDIVAMRPPGYVLLIDEDDVDVHRLDQHVAAARAAAGHGALTEAVDHFAEAEALWRGPALADFLYDDFARPHIARLAEVHLSLTEDRIDAELALGEHVRLASELGELVKANPLRERLRRQLMLALYRTGRQADALRVFQEGREALAEELGLDPGPELQSLELAILNQDPALLAPTPPVATAAPAAAGPRTNIKAALTPLIGRERELSDIIDLLDDRRLVTLVGPGGAGKTRLAMETARRIFDERDDAVFVIELAPIRNPEAVPDGIAAALELPDSGVDAVTRIQQYSESHDLLLVLDNCEHLVDAAARIAEQLLGACKAMRIVATSREALRVPGEAVWPVPPLDGVDAFELFVDRATAADATFVVDHNARSVIDDICTRLDGLPLAIELAAARTRAFTVDHIAERLDDRFRLLSGGSRTAMARQQTLRAVVDWSYDLLFDDERRVFERLSVFPGGCGLSSARAVAAGVVDEDDVEELVGSLVDKSLLFADLRGAEPRYRMLQTLSQYGRERLVERGDADTAFDLMSAYFSRVVARSRDAFRGIEQRAWFVAIDAEQDNIRAAFDWAMASKNKELAVGIAADMALHRWVAGGAAEGYKWLDAALGLSGEASPFTTGCGLGWWAFLGFISGRARHVDDRFEEGLALLRKHDDPELVTYILSFYSQVAGATGRLEKATELNLLGLDELEKTSSPWATAARTWTKAALAIQVDGDFTAFEALIREALHRYREAGDVFMHAVCFDLVAEFDEFRGDFGAADTALHGALETARGLRPPMFEVALTARLATIAVQVGNYAEAEELLRTALPRAEELTYRPARAQALNALANMRRRQGRLDEAEAAASQALDIYRTAHAGGRAFPGSFSRAPAPFDIPAGAAASLCVLGFVAGSRGDASAATEAHLAAFHEAWPVGHVRAVPLALEGLAAAAVLAGDGARAGQLLGCADGLRSARSATRSPSEQMDVDRIRPDAIALAGDSVFDAAYADGAASSPDCVVTDSVQLA